MDFFSSEGYITFDKEAICSTKDLYEAYEIWAERNSVKPRTENSFARDVKQRAPKLGIEYLKNAAIDGRTARGQVRRRLHKCQVQIDTLKPCHYNCAIRILAQRRILWL